jgi:hypothetical protein
MIEFHEWSEGVEYEFDVFQIYIWKGGDPAAPSDTATLLRLSPNHWFHRGRLLPLRVSNIGLGCPQLSWLDGRCVQGSGTYSPGCS